MRCYYYISPSSPSAIEVEAHLRGRGTGLRPGHWRPQGGVGRLTSRIWLNEEEKRDQEAGLRERLEPWPEGREGGEELGLRREGVGGGRLGGGEVSRWGAGWNITARREGEVRSGPGEKAWNVKKEESISTQT